MVKRLRLFEKKRRKRRKRRQRNRVSKILSVVPAVPVVPALSLIAKFSFHLSPFSSFLSQCDIENHHYNKAYGKGYSAYIGVFALLGFGDKLLDNDIEHRTRRECKEIG